MLLRRLGARVGVEKVHPIASAIRSRRGRLRTTPASSTCRPPGPVHRGHGAALLGDLRRRQGGREISSYGSRPASFDFEFIRVQAHADSVSQRLLDKLREPRWLARVPLAWTKATPLERGDLIDLNIALFSTMGTRPKFKVVNISRSFQEEAWDVEAVEVN